MDNLQHFRDTLRTLIDEIVADDGEYPLNRLYTWAGPVNDAAEAAGLPQVIHIETCKGLPGHGHSSTIRMAFEINRLIFETTVYTAHPETGRTVRTTTEQPKGGIVAELRRWLTVRPEQDSATMPDTPAPIPPAKMHIIDNPSRPATFREVAGLLKMDPRTLQRSEAIRHNRVSERRAVFDLDEIDAINPDAADAIKPTAKKH